DLALHPLAEREVAHRLLEERTELEELDELVDPAAIRRALDPIDRPVALEGVDDRDVPDELVALAHHERDPLEIGALPPPRLEAEHSRLARGRVQEPGQHLQGRRLAGAV